MVWVDLFTYIDFGVIFAKLPQYLMPIIFSCKQIYHIKQIQTIGGPNTKWSCNQSRGKLLRKKVYETFDFFCDILTFLWLFWIFYVTFWLLNDFFKLILYVAFIDFYVILRLFFLLFRDFLSCFFFSNSFEWPTLFVT